MLWMKNHSRDGTIVHKRTRVGVLLRRKSHYWWKCRIWTVTAVRVKGRERPTRLGQSRKASRKLEE